MEVVSCALKMNLCSSTHTLATAIRDSVVCIPDQQVETARQNTMDLLSFLCDTITVKSLNKLDVMMDKAKRIWSCRVRDLRYCYCYIIQMLYSPFSLDNDLDD